MRTLFSCGGLLVWFFPLVIFAGEVTLLQPLPGDIGQSTDLGEYLPGVMVLLIALAGVSSAVVLVVGGIQYMSTDAISGKSAGREKMTNAILGLLLALASWVILNTILGIDSLSIDLTPPVVEDPNCPNPDTEPGPWSIVDPNESTVRERLRAQACAVVRATRGPSDAACPPGISYLCYSRFRPGEACTSVGCLKPSTVSSAIEVFKQCDVDTPGIACTPTAGELFTIVGGCEDGHAKGTCTHGSGDKIDVSGRSMAVLEACLMNAWGRPGQRFPPRQPVCGPYAGQQVCVYNEVDHLDISFNCVSSVWPIKPIIIDPADPTPVDPPPGTDPPPGGIGPLLPPMI